MPELRLVDGFEYKPGQRDGVKFMLTRHSGLLNYKTGSGKTAISYAAAIGHLKKGRADKFLLLGTKSSVIELMNWMPSQVPKDAGDRVNRTGSY